MAPKHLTLAWLREHGIYNPWGLAELQDEPRVYVDYVPQGDGRSLQSAGWRTYRVGQNTAQAFICYRPREDKERQRLAAIAWATERYEVAEWERSPFGSWHPKGTLAATPFRVKARQYAPPVT